MQDSLFDSPQDETEDKLASVLDSLESKFGETAVMSGALWQRFQDVYKRQVKENQMQKNLNILNRCLRNYVHLAV